MIITTTTIIDAVDLKVVPRFGECKVLAVIKITSGTVDIQYDCDGDWVTAEQYTEDSVITLDLRADCRVLISNTATVDVKRI